MADEKNEEVRYDIDGNDIITDKLMELLNTFPGLGDDEEIAFSKLPEESGIAMFPVSGAVIKSERTSVTGDVEQKCLYPMYIRTIRKTQHGWGMPDGIAPSIYERMESIWKWKQSEPRAVVQGL